MTEIDGTCPSCRSGDLISITMTVAGRELAFSTCHLCEAKWWYRDGEGRAAPVGDRARRPAVAPASRLTVDRIASVGCGS